MRLWNVVLLWGLPAAVLAGAVAGPHRDWPQYLGGPGAYGGPAGVELKLGADLLSRPVWRRTLGSGYSGVSVAGDRAVVLFAADGSDWVAALDPTTGEELWRFRLEETYEGHDGSVDGPLSTPALAGGRVHALSARGRLVALDLESGGLLWQHQLQKEYRVRAPHFGFASSPAVAGGLAVVLAGGRREDALMAFDAASGELRWSAGSEEMDYASPVVTTLAGVPQVITLSDESVFSVRLRDGKLLWRLGEKPDGWGTALPIPENRLILPMDDGIAAVRVTRREKGDWHVEKLWTVEPISAYASFLGYRDGHVYGVHKGETLCIDAGSGRVAWRSPSSESSAVLIGNALIVLDRKSGELRVIAARPDRFQEVASARILQARQHYTPPSFAAGLLFLRAVDRFAALSLTGEGSPAPPSDAGRPE